MLAQSMRPKYKADTYYIPLSDGVYLRGNNSRLILKGKSLYPLLEHLVPHLNGTLTLAEITGGLDADRKRMVTQLIEKLLAHQLLKDTSQDQRHTLQQVELETYASEIAFIESFQTSAAHRFECFRNKRLLIIASGHCFTSLVQTSLQCGVKQISVIGTQEDEAVVRFRQDGRDGCASSASTENTRLLETPRWDHEAEVRDIIQNYDAILHVVEEPLFAHAQLLNRLCVEQQKTLIQAIIVDKYAWLGPLVSPETGACWECAWRRLQANRTNFSNLASHDVSHNQLQAANKSSLSIPEATLIANRLLFMLFQHFTQTRSAEAAGVVSALDLDTFLSESHAFLPHPRCLSCQHPVVQTASQFLEQIQHLQQQSPDDPHSFLKNFAGCVDEELGLFTNFDNSQFAQSPLAVYTVRLSNPLPGEHQSEPVNVVAVSIDTREAAMRAAQKACEHYAANLVDKRRLFPLETIQPTLPVIAPEQLIGAKIRPSSEDEMGTWALDLQTQQAVCVPASHVFSTPGAHGRGIASGQTWQEAVCQALLDWCNYLTVEHLQDAQQAYPQVDLDRTPMTPEGAHLYRLLKATGEQITVYDVTGPLRVPTFATLSGEKVLAYSTHCDATRALSMGLEQALQHYQAEQFQQFDYALAPVPVFPANLRSDRLLVPHYTSPDTWSARLEWVLQQLQAHGLSACVAPLNQDPALAQALPFIARVLLSRRELKKGE